MNATVFVIFLCVGVVWFIVNRGRFSGGSGTALARRDTRAKAAWVEEQMAWTDGRGHYYDTLQSLDNSHGWTVIVHERMADGTIGRMQHFAGQYTTEKEAWAAAQMLAEQSAARAMG